MKTNNVIRLLTARNARFTPFSLPEEKLGAIETAQFLNIPIATVYKSIVVLRTNGKPAICLVPGHQKVDLKKVAMVLNEKKVAIASQQEAERLTGLQVGGISPLALLNKGFTFIFDQSVNNFEYIHLSGGERGLNLRINCDDLLAIVQPEIAGITDQE
jgi:Cys-tRNA(Pro)/Cys-tRNA(Cys) deacylase